MFQKQIDRMLTNLLGVWDILINQLYSYISIWRKNSVQFSLSVMSNSLWPHGLHHARPPYPSSTPRIYPNSCPLSWYAIQPSHPLSSPSPPALNLSQHQGPFKESAPCIRWPKYWSFSFNISPSNEHPRLISFRMDWLDLLVIQGTLKSLLAHHSSKASILWQSAFFMVQLSHPYMTTGKNFPAPSGKPLNAV